MKHLRNNTLMKLIIKPLAITALAALALVGCNQNTPSSSNDTTATNSSMSGLNSTIGGTNNTSAVNSVPVMNTNTPVTNSLPDMNTNLPAGTNQ